MLLTYELFWLNTNKTNPFLFYHLSGEFTSTAANWLFTGPTPYLLFLTPLTKVALLTVLYYQACCNVRH